MRKSLLASASVAGLTLFASFGAAAATYIPVTLPDGAVSGTVFGINHSDTIAGSYKDSAGVEHGFFGPLNGTYTTFDVTGTGIIGTEPRGISVNGAIDGFAPASGFTIGEEFYRSPKGVIRFFRHRQAPLDGVSQGINPQHVSMGDFFDKTGTRMGFVGEKGHFVQKFDLQIAGYTQNSPRKEAEDGTVAGYFIDSVGGEHGFVQSSTGVDVIDYPDDTAILTVLEGINGAGQASGQWDDTAGNPHSFVLNTNDGTFTTVDPGDGSSFQQAWGINDKGLVPISTSLGLSYIYCPLDPAECPAGGFAIKNKTIKVAPSIFRNHDAHGRTARHLPPANSVTKHGAIQ